MSGHTVFIFAFSQSLQDLLGPVMELILKGPAVTQCQCHEQSFDVDECDPFVNMLNKLFLTMKTRHLHCRITTNVGPRSRKLCFLLRQNDSDSIYVLFRIAFQLGIRGD